MKLITHQLRLDVARPRRRRELTESTRSPTTASSISTWRSQLLRSATSGISTWRLQVMYCSVSGSPRGDCRPNGRGSARTVSRPSMLEEFGDASTNLHVEIAFRGTAMSNLHVEIEDASLRQVITRLRSRAVTRLLSMKSTRYRMQATCVSPCCAIPGHEVPLRCGGHLRTAERERPRSVDVPSGVGRFGRNIGCGRDDEQRRRAWAGGQGRGGGRHRDGQPMGDGMPKFIEPALAVLAHVPQ